VIGIRLLTSTLRKKLKSPLGLLIQGSFTETMQRLRGLIDEEKPSLLISVGDVVSSNMISYGIAPRVLIVDSKVMRKRIAPIQARVNQTLHLRNPAGTLAEEAWGVMREALRKKRQTRVLVDGEEDLLTLVAVLCAPENALVIYGQPNEGIVIVRVTKEKKEHIRQIVNAMEQSYERLN
jgi:uncharacterized protein (UPF0218 family)